MGEFKHLKYYKPTAKLDNPQIRKADLCIYGGTSAGVSAALQASRMGLSVVIVEFGRHLGGLTSGGLGATDIGNKAAIGGISRQFYYQMEKIYEKDPQTTGGWTFEPKMAERLYNEWMEEAGVKVFYEQHLERVDTQDGRIRQIVMENGNIFTAEMFIDATYEGDLMARAGVSYHVGRESNATYKETLNGIHYGHPNHKFNAWVDPYVIEGKPDSGLLAGVSDGAPGFQGEGDSSIQAYNFRICLTNVPENRKPFVEPPNYNPDTFKLLARYITAGPWDALKLHIKMPVGKTDLNNCGAVSTDHIGHNYDWPEGDYQTREKIFQDHVHHNLGMLYFLANDEQIPKHIRDEVSAWGLPLDEFTETGGWPHQLYIREARRMVSDVVMTEHHCRHYQQEEDSIGLAAYTMDSHNCRRIVLEGRCINEGNVEIGPSAPYSISYRSIIPKAEECQNLFVPVCLSSSHIAFGSIRMEPVFMILGQSAATAAALAIENNLSVQEVDYDKLREKLLLDGQILEWNIID